METVLDVLIIDPLVLRERKAGYEQALRNAGLPLSLELIVHADFFHQVGGYEAVSKLLNAPKKPTAIEQMVDGNRLSDIGHAVQVVAEAAGFSVVRGYEGHAIGTAMHEKPGVPNYGEPGKGPKLKPGMVFAIEPMVNAGSHKTKVLDDGWSVVTADGSLSAHFEHTVAVTDDGPRILTTVREGVNA